MPGFKEYVSIWVVIPSGRHFFLNAEKSEAINLFSDPGFCLRWVIIFILFLSLVLIVLQENNTKGNVDYY